MDDNWGYPHDLENLYMSYYVIIAPKGRFKSPINIIQGYLSTNK